MTQVPYDNSSGSIVAQTKRNRNAQASKKFRANRKRDREEALAQISGLEEKNANLQEQLRVQTDLIEQQGREIGALKEEVRQMAKERDCLHSKTPIYIKSNLRIQPPAFLEPRV
ncbi:MAG: hypothetical protein LQ346_001314 [Caloplaca aetnensis]|nr:MAG: hypothetical protein LQ346_001314 [Caloplaca aetnensis]